MRPMYLSYINFALYIYTYVNNGSGGGIILEIAIFGRGSKGLTGRGIRVIQKEKNITEISGRRFYNVYNNVRLGEELFFLFF